MPPRKRRQSRRKQKQPRSNQNKREIVIKRDAVEVPKLSGCALEYARCLANPISGPLACVPTFPAIKSLKTRQWVRGSFSRSPAAGFGNCFVVMDPLRMCANDANAVYSSQSAFAGSDISVTTLTTGVFAANSNAMFPIANLSNTEGGYACRVVGAVLRVRYIGPDLYRNGRIYALHDPTHTTLDQRSAADMNLDVQTVVFHPSKDWITLNYKPCLIGDTNYTSALPAASQQYYMGFITADTVVDGIAPAYEFEAWAVLEYNGASVRGQTVSHADAPGFSAVHSITVSSNALNPSTMPDQIREKNAVSRSLDFLADNISGVTRVASDTYNSAKKLYGAVLPAAELAGTFL
jgi:hypothetical protein